MVKFVLFGRNMSSSFRGIGSMANPIQSFVLSPLSSWARAPEMLRWYHWMPGVNQIHTLLFDQVPSWDNMEKLLNTIALIDALLLSIIVAIPASCDRTELQNAARVVALDESWRWFWEQRAGAAAHRGSEYLITDLLAEVNSLGLCCVSSALIIVMVVYLQTVVHSESTFPHQGETQAMADWWWWARWLFAAAFAETILGAWLTAWGYNIMVMIKFPINRSNLPPDMDAATLRAAMALHPEDSWVPQRMSHPLYPFLRVSQNTMLLGSFVASFVVLSMATRAKYIHLLSPQSLKYKAERQQSMRGGGEVAARLGLHRPEDPAGPPGLDPAPHPHRPGPSPGPALAQVNQGRAVESAMSTLSALSADELVRLLVTSGALQAERAGLKARDEGGAPSEYGSVNEEPGPLHNPLRGDRNGPSSGSSGGTASINFVDLDYEDAWPARRQSDESNDKQFK